MNSPSIVVIKISYLIIGLKLSAGALHSILTSASFFKVVVAIYTGSGFEFDVIVAIGDQL